METGETLAGMIPEIRYPAGEVLSVMPLLGRGWGRQSQANVWSSVASTLAIQ